LDQLAKGVEEEDSGASMLPASAILENCGLGDMTLLEHIFQVENH